jgi:hypothetical protein
VLGGGGFFVLEWVLCGDLAHLNSFACYPVIALCALIGWVREERSTT